MGPDLICTECFTIYGCANKKCPHCGSESFFYCTIVRRNNLRKLVRQPRRVEVTEEQARKIFNAHQIIKAQQLEVDVLTRQRNRHAETIEEQVAELDRIMDEINGETPKGD